MLFISMPIAYCIDQVQTLPDFFAAFFQLRVMLAFAVVSILLLIVYE